MIRPQTPFSLLSGLDSRLYEAGLILESLVESNIISREESSEFSKSLLSFRFRLRSHLVDSLSIRSDGASSL